MQFLGPTRPQSSAQSCSFKKRSGVLYGTKLCDRERSNFVPCQHGPSCADRKMPDYGFCSLSTRAEWVEKRTRGPGWNAKSAKTISHQKPEPDRKGPNRRRGAAGGKLIIFRRAPSPTTTRRCAARGLASLSRFGRRGSSVLPPPPSASPAPRRWNHSFLPG